MSCTQKFTIDNEGPKIKCPDGYDIICVDEINSGVPQVEVSCDLHYTVVISDPQLIAGIPNCPGAFYAIVYEVTDECGRFEVCEQYFKIIDQDLEVICPDDKTVQCKDEIASEKPVVNIACSNFYNIEVADPQLISGEDDCPGAIYRIIYVITDSCDRRVECRQLFTIENVPPELVCLPDQIVECRKDIFTEQINAHTKCGKEIPVDPLEPNLIKGQDNCDGAQYAVVYKTTDDCGREVECTQTFTLQMNPPEIICPEAENVDYQVDIVKGVPKVKTYCGHLHDLQVFGPVLVSGEKDCPGAIYEMTYEITDDCNSTASCIQRFTIKDRDITVDCPPDVIIECREEIKDHTGSTTSWLFGPILLDRTSGPKLIKGRENCEEAVYEVIYHLNPECESEIRCVQLFIIKNDGPKITCPPDVTITDLNQQFDKTVNIETSCALRSYLKEGQMLLASGSQGKPGSTYTKKYIAEDDCGREAECIQNIKLISKEIPAPPDRVICRCQNQSSQSWLLDGSTSFRDDIESLLRKYGVSKLKRALTNDQLYDLWLNNETLGTQATYLFGIKIKDIFTTLKDMTKAIQIAEELISGSSKRVIQLAGEWLIQSGTKRALGTGAIGAVYTAIKTLYEFAGYMDGEIIELNLKMFANNYADRDPDFFNVHHFLKTYAKVGTASQINWNAGATKRAIKSYAAKELQIDLGDFRDWNTDPNAYNYAATATNRFLKDVCEYYCKSKAIRENLKKLKAQKELLERYRAVFEHINSLDDISAACTIPNATMVTNSSGMNECECDQGYKFTSDQTQCVLFDDCSTVMNSIEVYRSGRYYCDCIPGYKLDPTSNNCVASDNCGTANNTIEVFRNGRYECECISGYKRDQRGSKCVPYEDCSRINSAVEVFRGDRYECECISGYKWDPDGVRCVPYEDCSAISNSEQSFNGVSYRCECLPGYEWNSNKTACTASLDCSAFANTEAVWNASIQDYECECISGYELNADFSNCVEIAPDCQSYYPNSEAVWNAQLNRYECSCIIAYEWNPTKTACIDSRPDCQSFYPNSSAVWNGVTNIYECDCMLGYQWNADATACVAIPSALDCNVPNSVLMYDRVDKQYYCECALGYKWNRRKTKCVKRADPSETIGAIGTIIDAIAGGLGANSGGNNNPTVRPENQNTGQCNVTYGSGANEPEQYTIDVYQTFGNLEFKYETFKAKDRIHIYQGSRKIFDSGCVGTQGTKSQSLRLNGVNSVFRVVVDPLCDPNDSATQWNFIL